MGGGGGTVVVGPPAESRCANQGELGAEQPGGGQPRRVGDGGLAVLRQPHRVGLGHEQDVAFIGGAGSEKNPRAGWSGKGRVGREGKAPWAPDQLKKKKNVQYEV